MSNATKTFGNGKGKSTPQPQSVRVTCSWDDKRKGYVLFIPENDDVVLTSRQTGYVVANTSNGKKGDFEDTDFTCPVEINGDVKDGHMIASVFLMAVPNERVKPKKPTANTDAEYKAFQAWKAAQK